MSSKKLIRFITVLILFSISFMACKQPNCQNARVCVKNVGAEVIWYAWNSSAYSDSLAPGDEACKFVGEISGGSSYVTTFNSDHGSYAIEVTECEQKQEIK